jgi:adenine-specific DNA-methyltransferase
VTVSNDRVKAPVVAVLTWLLAPPEVEPVPAEWVPGAQEQERVRLAALGGLVNALVGRTDTDDPHPAFTEPDLQSWLSSGPHPPEDVILAGKTLLAESQEDGLAQVYASVVSSASRRTLGTFFTAPSWVNWMIDRWAATHDAPTAVVDVGAGVGIFTTAAAGRWPDAQVWSVDINPITLGLLALRVHGDMFPLRTASESAAGLRVVQRDFTRWMVDAWPDLPEGRLILGNPPYTRLQLLPIDQRDRLWEAAGGLCGRRASLSALITAMSLNALAPADGLCLLLPAQWLESDYAKDLRAHLWGLRNRRVEMHLFEEKLFDDAQVDAVALVVGPEQKAVQPLIFSGGASLWEPDRGGPLPSKWRARFEGPGLSNAPATEGNRLGDLLSVRRGVATGANAFFVIPERRVAEAVGTARTVLRPLIRRLLSLPDIVTTEVLENLPPEERYWLLTADKKAVDRLKGLSAYVADGVEKEFDQRHLCQTRPVWHDLTAEVFVPDLVIGQSTKKVFRILENRAQATLVNNLYGMTWKSGVDATTRTDLLDWLRSDDGQAALTAQARTQGAQLKKIEPKALLRVRIPDRFTPPQVTLE